MPINKYISTKDAVRLTGLSTQEIYDLIHSGTLPARKAPKSGWRISPQDLATLGLINEEGADSIAEEPQTKDDISYVADEEHYSEVFKRMTEVKRSLKIATANLKNFNVIVESDGGDETLRLCDFFLSLVERGVYQSIVVERREDAHQMAGVVDGGPVEQDEVLRSLAAPHLIAARRLALALHARQQLEALDDIFLAEQDRHLGQRRYLYLLHTHLHLVHPLTCRMRVDDNLLQRVLVLNVLSLSHARQGKD